MVGSVETTVESCLGGGEGIANSVQVRMLGPLAIHRDGVALALPASRKVRGLFAYLVLAPHAVGRSQLCELLWDIPNDPRGELRWCLSKIRRLLDEAGLPTVLTEADTIGIDLTGCCVDAVEVAQGARTIDTLDTERLQTLAALFAGEFLEGLDIDRSPAFNGWLVAQRRRFHGWQAALLERLAGCAADEASLGHLEAWLKLAPFDPRVHQLLLGALARQGRLREGDEHLAATILHFEAEDLDCTGIRDAWRLARAHAGRPPCAPAAVPEASRSDSAMPGARRASIAVMPFADLSALTAARGGAGDALAHDVITRLAKLRSTFVIAQGSVFALNERRVAAEDAGRMLGVDYVLSGSVRRQAKRLTVSVELADTLTGRIVWAETFDQTLDDVFPVLHEIGNRIVAFIATEIEANERNRAILKPPSSLDAWGAHHRGLWHMYRFNKADNALAQRFFETAVRLDPTFSRAYAGLSFTHFQSAFQGWAKREPEIDRAFGIAGQGLMADGHDPAAHLAMGRALWLRGRQDQAVDELEQAVGLSPNFAMGHYTLAFVHSQSGDPRAAISFSDHSRHLSPFDPLLFAMLGARAMALARLERFDEAADWGVKAAARPNAHAHVVAIGAFSLALAGRLVEARAHFASIRRALPRYGIGDFLTAMHFAPDGERLFREAARRIG